MKDAKEKLLLAGHDLSVSNDKYNLLFDKYGDLESEYNKLKDLLAYN